MTYLPFLPRFHEAIKAGRKRYTLRSKMYVNLDDSDGIVQSPVGPLRVLSVRQETVRWVRDNLWADEGCASPAEFEAVWHSIHPNQPDLDRLYYLHEFEPVINQEKP